MESRNSRDSTTEGRSDVTANSRNNTNHPQNNNNNNNNQFNIPFAAFSQRLISQRAQDTVGSSSILTDSNHSHSPNSRPSLLAGPRPGRPQSLATSSSSSNISPAIPRGNNMLLAGLNLSALVSSTRTNSNEPNVENNNNNEVNTRPRRLWKVSDHSLPPIPPFYPPINWQSSTYITDASPSVVAIRIAECLRRRNVAVEYDEESATATALTVDRCAFTIHLWRPLSTTATNNIATSTSMTTSFSASVMSSSSSSTTTLKQHVVIVECVRTRGPVQTYHWTVRALLQASQGLDNGVDRRTPYQASPLEYPRTQHCHQRQPLSLLSPNNQKQSAQQSSMAAMESLEHAFDLVRKDRVEAQQLGLQSLVALTDVHGVGVEAALYAAVALLGRPLTVVDPDNDETSTTTTATPPVWCLEGQQWLYGLIVHGQLPLREQQASSSSSAVVANAADPTSVPLSNTTEPRSCTVNPLSSLLRDAGDGGEHANDNEAAPPHPLLLVTSQDDQHAGALRSLALRVLTNCLTLLADHQAPLLESILSTPSRVTYQQASCNWTGTAAVQAFTDDLQGASRPPEVVHGSRLASPHEAVMAVQILGVLGAHSVAAKRTMLTNESTLALLERARQVGRCTLQVLEEEASRVYEFLTERERSC